MSKCTIEGLKEAAEPLVKYLKENANPYTVVAVTSNSIELLESVTGIPYIKDTDGEPEE